MVAAPVFDQRRNEAVKPVHSRLFQLFGCGESASRSDFVRSLLCAYVEPVPSQNQQDDRTCENRRRKSVFCRALGLCSVHGKLRAVLDRRHKMASFLVLSRR